MDLVTGSTRILCPSGETRAFCCPLDSNLYPQAIIGYWLYPRAFSVEIENRIFAVPGNFGSGFLL
jgi:hypothetical protein